MSDTQTRQQALTPAQVISQLRAELASAQKQIAVKDSENAILAAALHARDTIHVEVETEPGERLRSLTIRERCSLPPQTGDGTRYQRGLTAIGDIIPSLNIQIPVASIPAPSLTVSSIDDFIPTPPLVKKAA